MAHSARFGWLGCLGLTLWLGACSDSASPSDEGSGACGGASNECDGACVSLDQDEVHCGDCDTRCESDQSCVQGQCRDSDEGEGGTAGQPASERGGSAEAGSGNQAGADQGGAATAGGGNRAGAGQGGDTPEAGAGQGGAATAGSGVGADNQGGNAPQAGADQGGTATGGAGDSGAPNAGNPGLGGATAGAPSQGGMVGQGGSPVPTVSSCTEAFVEDSSCPTASGTTYYVSSSQGDDGATGLSDQTPLASIAAVNALQLLPGDRVLFKCGDTWDLEQLNLVRSGEDCRHIVYSSYPAPCEAGQAPTLSGRREIQGWSQDAGNVWVANLAEGENAGRFPRGINQLFSAEERLPMGVWPNPGELAQGFSYVDRHDGSTLEDDELPAVDWSGAVLRIRTVRWLLLNREVVSSSGAALTLNAEVGCYADTCGNPDPTDSDQHGFGYQLTNHRNTLDRPGEWHFDAENQAVYLVSETAPHGVFGSAIPDWANESEADWDYDGAVRIGVHLEDHIHHVVLENLNIEGYFGSGISTPINHHVDEDYNLVLRCNGIRNVEARGLNLQTWVYEHPTLSEWYGGRNLLVQGNVIDGPNHYGIQSYAQNSVFLDNVVVNIGVLANLGKRGLGCAMEGDNCTENGDGIHLPISQPSINSHDLVFRNNVVARTAYCGFDVFGNDITIEQNLIEQACVTKADCGAMRTFGNENGTGAQNLTIDHNIIVEPVGNVDGGGMGFDTPMAFGLYIDMYSEAVTATGNSIVRTPASGILYQNSNGTIEGNTLFDTASVMGQPIDAPSVTPTSNTMVDTTSQPGAVIFYNPTNATVQESLASNYHDLAGNAVTGSVSIAAYESVILIED